MFATLLDPHRPGKVILHQRTVHPVVIQEWSTPMDNYGGAIWHAQRTEHRFKPPHLHFRSYAAAYLIFGSRQVRRRVADKPDAQHARVSTGTGGGSSAVGNQPMSRPPLADLDSGRRPTRPAPQ